MAPSTTADLPRLQRSSCPNFKESHSIPDRLCRALGLIGGCAVPGILYIGRALTMVGRVSYLVQTCLGTITYAMQEQKQSGNKLLELKWEISFFGRIGFRIIRPVRFFVLLFASR